jgi:hypothetical protein
VWRPPPPGCVPSSSDTSCGSSSNSNSSTTGEPVSRMGWTAGHSRACTLTSGDSWWGYVLATACCVVTLRGCKNIRERQGALHPSPSHPTSTPTTHPETHPHSIHTSQTHSHLPSHFTTHSISAPHTSRPPALHPTHRPSPAGLKPSIHGHARSPVVHLAYDHGGSGRCCYGHVHCCC